MRKTVEKRKRESASQLLMRVGRRINELGLARLRESDDYANVRASHLALFPHIEWEGSRITDLARKLDISKQAVQQVVDDLEVMGVVERRPDPEDGRAKLVCFADGGKPLLEGLEVLRTIDEDLRDVLGKQRAQQFRKSLLDVLDWLETDD